MHEHTNPRLTTVGLDRGISLVGMSGALDAASHRQVAAELDAVFDMRPAGMLLDLRDVDFLGSAGIALLLNAHHRAGRAGIPFAVVADGRPVLHPLRMSQVDGALPLYPTVDGALAALRLVWA
ncbi:STAS domain-containing protein [Saccharothrix syringae]|nr:STAS domain-containing protein [Saccharothrix syringae]